MRKYNGKENPTNRAREGERGRRKDKISVKIRQQRRD